jgi:hypothetical protein
MENLIALLTNNTTLQEKLIIKLNQIAIRQILILQDVDSKFF